MFVCTVIAFIYNSVFVLQTGNGANESYTYQFLIFF